MDKKVMKVISIMSIEKERVKIEKVEDYYRIFVDLLKFEEKFLHDKEHLWVLAIDDEGKAACVYIAALGIERITLANAFDLFKASLQFEAEKIIIAHNQIDAGLPQAGDIDLDYTNRIWHKARIVNIDLIDHIIITKKSLTSDKPIYYSYKEHNLIEFIKQDITHKSVDEAKEEIDREKDDSRREGEESKAIEIVQEMLKRDCDIELIMSVTKLDREIIEKIELDI